MDREDEYQRATIRMQGQRPIVVKVSPYRVNKDVLEVIEFLDRKLRSKIIVPHEIPECLILSLS